MNRRSFLIYSGLAAVAAAIGVGGYVSYIQEEKIVTTQTAEFVEADGPLELTQPTESVNSYEKLDDRLIDNLETLFDVSFESMAAGAELNFLLIILRDKGVIDAEDEVDTARVKELALTDPAVQYNGWYYSQTEFELYGLAYLIHGIER